MVETDARKLFLHSDLSIEPFLKHDLALRLDADAQLCPDYTQAHSCPRGATCPLRHVQPSPLNFQPKPPVPASAHARTVCKHWLRGLCKKGTSCEFMHEYHLRKMPECWFFAKYGFCSNGDEVSSPSLPDLVPSLLTPDLLDLQCMYLHVTEEMRIRECPRYRKGFCPDGKSPSGLLLDLFPETDLPAPKPSQTGPNCKLKHVRRVMCPDYLVGFCPKGKDCPLGQ